MFNKSFGFDNILFPTDIYENLLRLQLRKKKSYGKYCILIMKKNDFIRKAQFTWAFFFHLHTSNYLYSICS